MRSQVNGRYKASVLGQSTALTGSLGVGKTIFDIHFLVAEVQVPGPMTEVNQIL